MDAVVDLRSDTVTVPTDAMREAIANAAVGDDVWREDPSVGELEARIAWMTGKEASIYVPSGTMGNQLALRSHSQPGDQLICHADAHVHWYEAGAPAALSGLQTTTVSTPDGSMPWTAVEACLHDPEDVHQSRARIIAFENTHNRCGGRVQDQAVLDECARRARERGLATHLDGARLFNASVATGIAVRDLAARVDSVSLCFSKGLGAPVGSALAGPREFVDRARFFRKQWGGGMRQAGILAAACLHALDHHVDRLADDHRHATALAQSIDAPGWTLRARPETNIVLWDLDAERDSGWYRADLEESGILVSDFGPRTIRMVTHLGIGTKDVDRAIETVNARTRRALGGGNR